MNTYRNHGSFIIFVAVLMGFCGKIEGATVTCEPQYGFLPCTTQMWGSLFLFLVYQFVMSEGQSFISNGSDKFFKLVGPGIFGASLFHVLANFPTLFLILESGLSSDDTSSSAAMGMNVLAGNAVMSLTLIWPSVIAFGSYDLCDDDDTINPPQEISKEDEIEPSCLTKLTAYGLTTDKETRLTARIMLISMIPFLILQLPKIINSTLVTRVIVVIALIITLIFFFSYIFYQIFQPWIQNRRLDYLRHSFVKNNLLNLLYTNGKPNARLIKSMYKGLDKNHDGKVSGAELRTFLLGMQVQAEGEASYILAERIVEQFDISGDQIIQEEEFVNILTKWLKEAMKSLPNNDNTPLPLFNKKNKHADDKEKQEALIPKMNPNNNDKNSILEFLEALALVVLGTAITALIAQPLTSNVAAFAAAANVPSFLIPYFIIPCAINTPRFLSTIRSARRKTHRDASLTLSQIYSGVFMSNMSSLSTFLLTIFIEDVEWDVSAEVLVVLIICGVMGVFTSTRTVYPLWTGYAVYVLYPISLLQLYLLTVVWGWN